LKTGEWRKERGTLELTTARDHQMRFQDGSAGRIFFPEGVSHLRTKMQTNLAWCGRRVQKLPLQSRTAFAQGLY
jgi:hypothetical protein